MQKRNNKETMYKLCKIENEHRNIQHKKNIKRILKIISRVNRK